MISFRLYTALAFSVLLLAGCGDEPEAPSASPESPQPAAAAPSGTSPARASADARATVLFLGDSITAGYGLDDPARQAFPALLQQRIDSLGWDFRVVNAGLSGETSSGGRRRLGWLLRQPVDVLVVELGGNDGLRGIPSEVTRRNLQAIIDTTRSRYPEARIVLAGMQLPPNLGADYAARFRALYPDLARANDVKLIPFVLEGVGGVPRLNLADGIHPTAEGHRIVARTVWDILEPVLREMQP